MDGLRKLSKEVRAQLGLGVVIIVVSMVWFLSILYFVDPDQIVPTKETVQTAYDTLLETASIPFGQWTFTTAGEVIARALVLIFLDVLFVAARYGGLTLFFLGGYIVMDALSNPRNVRR